MRLIGSLFDRLFVVAGALLCMQLPLFMQMYQHQLIGHVQELRWEVTHIKTSAAKSGKTVEQYIGKFKEQKDKDFSSQGEMLDAVHTRFQKLALALEKLQEASSLSRPWAFFRYIEWDIFKSTLTHFTPGLPLSIEGGLYALFGILLGFLLFRVLTLSF